MYCDSIQDGEAVGRENKAWHGMAWRGVAWRGLYSDLTVTLRARTALENLEGVSFKTL